MIESPFKNQLPFLGLKNWTSFATVITVSDNGLCRHTYCERIYHVVEQLELNLWKNSISYQCYNKWYLRA